MLYSRRGGRVQINALQFQELVDRIAELENKVKQLAKPSTKKETKDAKTT